MRKALIFLCPFHIVGIGLYAASYDTSLVERRVEEVLGPTPSLSEQPNEATFREYFSEIGLGKLPPGKTLPEGLEQNVSIFAPGDQFCQYGTVIKEVSPSLAYFGTQAKKVVKEGTFPRALLPGGFAGCELLDLPAGKYEVKVYVDDVLVAVLPFEVR